jgi:hypothetical protein
MTKTTERPFRRYRGVAIYRIKDPIVGTGGKWRDGVWIETTPKYDIYYAYAGGYWEDSLAICKMSIDNLISDAIIHGCTEQSMVDELNED